MNGSFAIDLQSFCNVIGENFKDCADLVIRSFEDPDKKSFAIAYFDGLSDRTYITASLILPLSSKPSPLTVPSRCPNASFEVCGTVSDACKAILGGNAVIYSEQEKKAYVAGVRSEEYRGIENAGVEEVVRGPHDSFIEDLQKNVSLIRRRLKTTELKCRMLSLGEISQTSVAVMWLQGEADPDTVAEVEKRILSCELKTVHDSGTLEMAILDGKFSVFPMLGNTERPDKAAAKISEGRVAVIVDGSPVVLTAPNLYVESLQSADDYSKSPQYASFARVIRLLTVLMSLLLPAVYLAIIEYHQTVLPEKLLLTLARERQAVPYSVFFELLAMLFVFDVIREVGQRMPRAMGSVVSIVAGIVLGDAALSAGLAGAPTLMAVALCATCAYVSPPVTWTNILLKYLFVTAAQLAGLFGVLMSLLALISYLCSKTSFGVPYLSPMAPLVPEGIKDTVIKLKTGVQK